MKMKKITKILLVLVFACIVFIGVGCKKNNSSIRENPALADGTTVYYSVQEGSYKYDITKQELYTFMKRERGASSLIYLVDSFLLKDVDGVNYMAQATEDEVKKFIAKEVYGTDDANELTAEEKEEKEKAFLASYRNNFDCLEISIYGQTILDRYQVTVAQKLYAKAVLAKEYADHMAKYEDESNKDVTSPYFTDTQYANVYNKEEENLSTFKAIIVPFTTKKAAETAKASVGELNSKEAYIDLYKKVYNYKYVDESDFDLDTNDINSTVLAKLEKLEDGEGTADPILVNDGQLYVYVYRISGVEKTKFADLEKEAQDAVKAKDSKYTQKLLDNALTTTYISTKIVELRANKNLAIYDDVLEYTYSEAIANYGTYTENTEVKECVASVDGKEFTTTDLFDQMLKDAKLKNILEMLVNKRLLLNKEYNSFLNEDGSLNADKAKELDDKLAEEKKNFEDGTYSSYGYDPEKVSWKTFLEGTYAVSTDEEYKQMVLIDDVIADCQKKVNRLEQYTTETVDGETKYNFSANESDKWWALINAGMADAASKYFSVTGVHVLVSLYDDVFSYASGATQLDPTVEDTEWSDAQVAAAKELLDKVVDYLTTEKGTYAEKLDKLALAYKSAPTVAGNTLSVFNYGDNKTIDLYSYKALGLTLIWQNLGTFANGSMVEDFNTVSKNIWDYTQEVENNKLAELTAENPTVAVDGVNYTLRNKDVLASGIETKFGYHVFVETAATSRTNLEDEEAAPARYIPTLEEIQKNVSGQTVASKVKTAISTYYSKYQEELKGINFFNVLQNNDIKNLVSDDDLKAYIDNYNDYIFDNSLKSVTKEFLD